MVVQLPLPVIGNKVKNWNPQASDIRRISLEGSGKALLVTRKRDTEKDSSLIA